MTTALLHQQPNVDTIDPGSPLLLMQKNKKKTTNNRLSFSHTHTFTYHADDMDRSLQ
jgi:hypothetical protein